MSNPVYIEHAEDEFHPYAVFIEHGRNRILWGKYHREGEAREGQTQARGYLKSIRKKGYLRG